MTAPLAPTARLVTAMFAGSGVLHLVRPQIFEPIVPRVLPAHRELVLVSGVAEIACAAGLLHPSTSHGISSPSATSCAIAGRAWTDMMRK